MLKSPLVQDVRGIPDVLVSVETGGEVPLVLIAAKLDLDGLHPVFYNITENDDTDEIIVALCSTLLRQMLHKLNESK